MIMMMTMTHCPGHFQMLEKQLDHENSNSNSNLLARTKATIPHGKQQKQHHVTKHDRMMWQTKDGGRCGAAITTGGG